MHEVADKYDCKKYIKLRHSIQGAVWNESSGKWDLTVRNGDNSTFVDHVDVFINAGGVLK
jgi:cation diffusion facilitator CzcD-associated flavoprotein CzcO